MNNRQTTGRGRVIVILTDPCPRLLDLLRRSGVEVYAPCVGEVSDKTPPYRGGRGSAELPAPERTIYSLEGTARAGARDSGVFPAPERIIYSLEVQPAPERVIRECFPRRKELSTALKVQPAPERMIRECFPRRKELSTALKVQPAPEEEKPGMENTEPGNAGKSAQTKLLNDNLRTAEVGR